ncbi:cytochrome P450 [Streptomyces niveiscabiei]|uniref:cytochrome P450 n=1 Tax=Streptomyces niveiscabiei TaxID=164115 RepID=UPI0029A26DFF|nr:cytochrome P450 [Streptomyces niveiscabiei]MDX3386232.1 cytochrome P450 [Streptomyces niveiscabiei]
MSLPSFPMDRATDRPLDPPPAYAELRESAPLTRARLWNGDTPWLVFRLADQQAILTDRRFSADATRPGFPQQSAATAVMSRQMKDNRPFAIMDGAEHEHHRRMLVREFTHRRMQRMRPRVEQITTSLLDGIARTGPPVDLVRAYALALPSLTICELLGVPYRDHAFFQEQTTLLATGDTDRERAFAANRELARYMGELVAEKERSPGDDIVSRLISGQLHPGHLGRERLVSTCLLLLNAGYETTANMLSLGTLALLQHPAQARELRDADSPELVENAVEELLRYLSITHLGRRRVALEPVEIAGVTIAAGEGVILMPDAANRDASAFPDPDRLDVHRTEARRHIAFGHGAHQCLGQPLARLELQVGYRTLLRRLPTLRLAAPESRPAFRPDKLIYGLEELEVTW